MNKKALAVLFCLVLLLSYVPTNEAFAEELPKQYKTKEVTAIENQGAADLCWAFAAAATMETELVKNNNAPQDINLSELYLAYFFRNPAMDELGQLNVISTGEESFNYGGNELELSGVLASGLSPLEEEYVPLHLTEATSETRLDPSLAKYSSIYLKECQVYRSLSNEELKNLILKYGAVLMSYNANEFYYNEDTYGWYFPEKGVYYSSPHSVSVVGWDDSYSKENFKITPPGDGAWIVKNSWGSDFGDNGYFYLSYYDGPSHDAEVFPYIVLDMEYGTYSNHIYQNVFSVSDGKYGYSYWDANGNKVVNYGNDIQEDTRISKLANVFTAQANEAGGELLTGVSVYTHTAGNYEIKIYKNLYSNTNPEGGSLAATLTGTLETAGFQIIPLEKPLYLSEGETFSVVVDLRDAEGNHVGVDRGDDEKTLAVMGQSYVYCDGSWLDYANCFGYNLFINAYTDDVNKDAGQDSLKVAADNIYDQMNYAQAVNDVKVVYTDSHNAVLTWENTSDTYYLVSKYNEAVGLWQKIGYTDKTYFVADKLSAGENYTFGVKGIAQAPGVSSEYATFYEGAEHSTAKTQTNSAVQTTPLLITSEEGNTVLWDEISGATKYEIYMMGYTTNYEWEKVGSVNADGGLSFAHKDILKGVEYTYRVYAYENNKLISKGIPVSGTLK